MKRDLSTKQPHRIGWVRGSSRFPAGPQRAALEAAGVTVIWSTEVGETIPDLWRAIEGGKRGDHLCVVGTHRLGASRVEYAATLELCARKGVIVENLETGAIVDAAAYAAVAGDIAVINGEVRMKGEVLASKRKSYATAGRKLQDGARSITECKRIWFDVHKVVTDGEAAALCGVSKRTLLRWFGSSGRAAGWPKRVRGTKR